MLRQMIYYDNPLLRKKAQPIDAINEEIKQLAQDLIDTMIAHNNGVGLAAPQIGVLLRIFVIRDEWIEPDGSFRLGSPEIFINPILSHPSKELEILSEGCLSIPGLHSEVERPGRIKIRYQTLEGHIKEEEASHFRARVIMHENDHLNGVLFIDRLSSEVRKKIEPRLRNIKKKYSEL